MARFSGKDFDKYSYSNDERKTGFFQLKDDKDTAKVRILYESADEIDGLSVHEVQINGKRKYVNCLREYNDPIDKCPFCQAKMKTYAKLYIPLYNEDAQQFQFWERGRTFYGKISGLVSRYKNIVSRTFEIERNGVKDDTKTDYSFYPVDDPDGTTIQDILDDLGFDEMPSPIGTIILDKSARDMDYYLDNGAFPDNDVPVRRRNSNPPDTSEVPFEEDAPTPRRGGRRTPARGTDRF